MPRNAIIIGLPETCRRLERQLDLIEDRPMSIGWVLTTGVGSAEGGVAPMLGGLDDLEAIVAERNPDLALVTLPSAMGRLITSVRTRLWKLGVPDRFMPTLADQIAGTGPRSRVEIDPGRLLDRPPRHIDQDAIRRVVRDKRVLITGAGGTIGGELARIVCRYGARQLVLVERAENALFEIDRQIARLSPQLGREALLHDVVDAKGTLAHLRRRRPHVVFHAAAHKHVPMMEDHPAAAVDNNFFGTKSVADAAHAVGAERFVLISTDKAVNPRSIMGATKRLAELYVQHLDLGSPTGFSIVRFGNVLGSTGSVLDVWSRELSEGGPLTVTDPRMTRYFMTIPEAAQLVIQSAALREPGVGSGAVYLLDMGEPIRVLDLARRFVALHGCQPESVGIVYSGSRPGEKLHEQLAYDAEAVRPTEHPDIRLWEQPAPSAALIEHVISVLSRRRRSPRPALVAETVRRLVAEPRQPAAA
ncbi:MAG: polysaccharide biosynthesis protein [Planctomycetota bacterium]|jgi:FlaA1/EpsC-like NDP-sugar epimerase